MHRSSTRRLDSSSGFVSVADYRLDAWGSSPHPKDTDFSRAWQEIRLTPILFNKGGKAVDSIHVELMSQDEEIEVLDNAATIERIEPGNIHQQTSFRIRCRATHLDRGRLKVMLKYANREDRFLLEVPFYSFRQSTGSQRGPPSATSPGVVKPYGGCHSGVLALCRT